MRGASTSTRFAWAALFALLLAVRSLAPAGFMPAFEGGAVIVVACPDAAPGTPMHHHGDHKSFHQPCPYAAASALGAVGPGWAPFIVVVMFAAALLLGRTFLFIERHATRERPPLRGPPVSA